MYGLEKKPKKFDFDLEVDLKKNPEKAKDLIQKATSHIQEIKTSLREGKKSEEFDSLGILLHGYTALQKVLSRISKS